MSEEPAPAEGYRILPYARERMQQRRIEEDWVRRALRAPDRVDSRSSEEIHYIKATREWGGKYLRVLTNPQKQAVFNAYFDSRLGRRQYPGRR